MTREVEGHSYPHSYVLNKTLVCLMNGNKLFDVIEMLFFFFLWVIYLEIENRNINAKIVLEFILTYLL